MSVQNTEVATVFAIEDGEPLNSDFYVDQIPSERLREKYTTTSITIPLKEEGEEVVIDNVSDLPDDSNELCVLLTNEECPAEYWMLVSQGYANQGKIDEAISVIAQALKVPFITNSAKEYADVNNFAAWLHILKADLYDDSAAFELASSNINTSISSSDKSNSDYNLLAEAVLSLITKQNKGKRTKFEKESRNFDVLLQKNPKNCYALMGKGKLFFYRQNYLAALKVFQKVLQLNPLLRPDPRIGIGLCYWFLDRKDLANQAWQNSIQVNPERNLEAKILISIAKFDDCFLNSVSDDDFTEKYIEAMTFTKASYKEDPSNEVIQTILASYYYSKGDTETVLKICDKLLSNKSATNFIKSEVLFWMARCKLLSNDILQAQKMFSDSIKQNENNTLARVGYAQCLVIRGEINDAVRTLEKVQELNSKILEVTYALGMLYSKISKFQDKAIVYLEKYVKIADDQNESVSVFALITLANLYEETDISKSLEFLLKAKTEQSLAGKSDEEISGILFNNIGVYSLLENCVTDAEKYFSKALDNIKNQYANDPETEQALEITLKYNIARAEESSNRKEKIQDAMKLYNEIIEQCPHYVNAKIRWLTIACLSEDKNIKEEVQRLLEEESDDLEVRSFYGWYLRKFGSKHGVVKDKSKDLESEHHRETLTRYTSHDCYALISMANVYCALAREVKEQQKKDQYYVRAAQLYQKVLNLDPKNAYAAQGIAIIFAEKKQNGLALEIFRKVRDSLNDITVYLNMAHCLLDLKQFAKAIENYELASTRFTDGKDARLLNYFARAWLLRGMYEKNLSYFKTAFKYVNESYELNPIPAYKFNITYIEYQLADFIRKLPPSKRSMEDLEQSTKGLEDAIVVLNVMAEDKTLHPPYPAEDLKLRAEMGSTLLKQLEKALDEQREHEQGFESRLREAKKLKEEEEKKKLEIQLKREEERKKMEEKLIAERKELELQQAEWNLLRMEEEKDNQDQLDKPEEKEKKKRGRKKKSDIDGDEPATKKKKPTKTLQKSSKLSNEFIDDSDEEAEFSEEENYDDVNDNEGDAQSSEEEDNETKVERKKNVIVDDEEDDDVDSGNVDEPKLDHEANASSNGVVEKNENEDDDDDDGLF
jgi:RNA polymerase-associated protein CTR9